MRSKLLEEQIKLDLEKRKQKEEEFDKKFFATLDIIEGIGTIIMPIIGGALGIWLFWDIGDPPVVVPTDSNNNYVQEYTVPATIYSTEHDICGMITKNDIKLFAEMKTVPTCKDVTPETAEVYVTVIKDEKSINNWKVVRISQNK